ncbi:MAG: hypothetical protein NVSMB54_29450 [Ktedonobacteraceae bacterium]
MSTIDIVRAFLTAIENNEKEETINPLADDFLFRGWTPKPLNRTDFITTFAELKSGIPGLMFNLHNLSEQENMVTGSIQIAGYQSNAFSIPPLSLPPVPQMARSISLPVEDVTFELMGDKITRWSVQHVAGGGIKGLLHQLGFDAPIIQ